MRVNVDKVLERDQKLSELDDRADALQAGASQFESSAAKLKRKYWWKNCKVRFCFWARKPSFLHSGPLMALHLCPPRNQEKIWAAASLRCSTRVGRQGELVYSESLTER